MTRSLIKYSGFLAFGVVALLSMLNIVAVSSKLQLDADTGNLIGAIYKYGYLQELIPKLSFGSSLETIAWVLVRAFHFGLEELQLLSAIIIIGFVLFNAYLIYFLFKNRWMAILSIVTSSFFFPSVAGYGSWALVTYSLTIFLSALLYYKVVTTSSSQRIYDVAKLLAFISILIIFDIRFLMPILAISACLFLYVFVKNRKPGKWRFIKKGVERQVLVNTCLVLFYSIFLTVLFMWVQGTHYEATDPRKAIHWNYYPLSSETDFGVISFIIRNTGHLISTALFSTDVISDYRPISVIESILAFVMLLIGIYSAALSKNVEIKILSMYLFFSVIGTLALSLVGIYAYGNIRYQLWLLFPIIVFVNSGLFITISFLRTYIINLFGNRAGVSFMALIIISVLVFILNSLFTNYHKAQESNHIRSQAIAAINNAQGLIIYDYVIGQRRAALKLNINNSSSIVIDRPWLKNYGVPSFSLKKLDKHLVGYRTLVFASTWRKSHPKTQSVLETIQKNGFVCGSTMGVKRFWVWVCAIDTEQKLSIKKNLFTNKTWLNAEGNNNYKSLLLELKPGEDVYRFVKLLVEKGDIFCQPITVTPIGNSKTDNVELKLQLWRHGSSKPEGGTTLINLRTEPAEIKLCHEFNFNHKSLRFYIGNKSDKSVIVKVDFSSFTSAKK